MAYGLSNTATSNMTSVVQDVNVTELNTDGANGQDEYTWQNLNWSKYWGYFNVRLSISRVLFYLIIYLGFVLLQNSSSVSNVDYSGSLALRQKSTPCNRQGLPLCIVTHTNCRLLPYSFHPYPSPLLCLNI